MALVHVQFQSGDPDAPVVSVFGCPQDEKGHPHQGKIEDNDPRYLAYLVPPSAPLPDIKNVIADERYKREGSGVVANGLLIDTTRDSQSLIASMAVAALIDSGYCCNFKTESGFVELDAAQILEISSAVRGHVQACFDRELVLLRVIEAGEYRDEMLAEGWPDSPPLPEPVELQ
ncbi:DUF4376 domain-containing protein [Pseudomonas sp. Ma2-10]